MSKKDDNDYLWIESSEHPDNDGKIWGYLMHDKECGWFIMATPEGEFLKTHMKIVMKTKG